MGRKWSKYNNPNKRRYSRKLDRSDADVIAAKQMFDDQCRGVKMPLSYYDAISDQLCGMPSRGISLDEAIKHAEKVAEEKESEAQNLEYSKLDWKYEANQCSECAKEHRQLAEWLKDYKRLLEQEPCEDAISRQAVLEFERHRLHGCPYEVV